MDFREMTRCLLRQKCTRLPKTEDLKTFNKVLTYMQEPRTNDTYMVRIQHESNGVMTDRSKKCDGFFADTISEKLDGLTCEYYEGYLFTCEPLSNVDCDHIWDGTQIIRVLDIFVSTQPKPIWAQCSNGSYNWFYENNYVVGGETYKLDEINEWMICEIFAMFGLEEYGFIAENEKSPPKFIA